MANGDFGLASGRRDDGTFQRLWYSEAVAPEEVAFEADVFLLTKAKAEALRRPATPRPPTPDPLKPVPVPDPVAPPRPVPPPAAATTLRLTGAVPPEVWNRLGTRLLPKLRSGKDLSIGLELTVTVDAQSGPELAADLRQALHDLGLADVVRVIM